MGTISEKLVYLNGTKQAIKQAINEDFEVIDDNTTFREYADEISSNNAKYKDLIPKETTNATNTLDISNSSDLDKALVTQYGNTYQEGEPTPDTPQEIVNISGKSTLKDVGKNLFDKNNVDWIKAYLTSSGTMYTSGNGKYCLGTNEYIKVLPNTTYYLSCSYGSNVDYLSNVFMCEYDKDKNYIVRKTHVDNNSFTTESNTQYIRISWYLFYDENNNMIETNVSSVDTYVTNIQLELSNEATTYEAYKEQSYNIALKSKNLFDGILEKANWNSVVGSTMTHGISTDQVCNTNKIQVKPNTIYKLSIDGTAINVNARYIYADENNIVLSSEVNSTGTITTPANCKYVGFHSATLYSSYGTNIPNMQLEENSTATEYEPFYDINLCKIGTYKDRIYNSGDKWYLEKNTGKVTLDGSESWNSWYNVENNIGFYYNNSLLAVIGVETALNGALYCNKFSETPLRTDIVYGNVEAIKQCGGTGVQYIALGLAKTRLSDWSTKAKAIESLKAWLSSDKPIVYYVLATPTTIEITENNYPTLYNQLNNIKLFEGVNHITLTNESGLDVEFDIEYYKDWKLD